MKYKVMWTEHYTCTATVEAESEEDAMAACYEGDGRNCSREFDGTSDWSARETGQGEP